MTLRISFNVLFFASYLLISFHLTQSHLPPSPSPSPTPQPKYPSKKVSSPSPSPSPATRIPVSSVSFPPSGSDSPSESPSEPPSGSISSDIIENDSDESEPISSDDDESDSSVTPETFEEDPKELVEKLISKFDPTDLIKEKTANTDPLDTLSGILSSSPLDNIDLSGILSSVEVDPKVKQICDSTDFPDLCLSTVIPHLKGKADISSILEVSITAGSKFAEYALSEAKKYKASPDTPPRVKSVITDCIDSYDTVLYNFEKATGAFPEKDIGTIGSVLSAVITDVGDCEDAFQETGEESPFSEFAKKLYNMTSNCLAMVALMRDN